MLKCHAVSFLVFPQFMSFSIERFFSEPAKDAYQKIVAPYQYGLGVVFLCAIADLIILIAPTPQFFEVIEIPLSISVGVAVCWLGFRLFRQVFDIYLLEAALQRNRKVDSEILLLAKFLANSAIVLVAVLLFAQTHKINLLGLLASLGIGGIAVAFAAQKTLEQVLGGIVIYVDRPFVIDDYIHLADGTFGRVESIGWRSTKIRTSGKGSLVIVPNNVLTQVNIENLTGAKKVISLIYLTFHRIVPEEEKALIRQIILDSTKDIFGIDFRSTEVIFKDIQQQKKGLTQAQINFFLLGSGEVSMDLRKQLLDIAKQNITQKFKEYGIGFELEEKTINVNSPITL
ncbi:mechanosensitive ion channel family protein [Lusitaniella coriacea]|uniref:mechanosensitive ion channel family protein n=1 Tax=Lusitaniella coriacea TaxID=1983105 RepID=UPI003CEFD5C0